MKHYRYELTYALIQYVESKILTLQEFKTIKETPCGYWIKSLDDILGISKQRWVSKDSRKRYAYPTKKEALESYIIRTRRRIEHLKIDMGYAIQGLEEARKLNGVDNEK